MSNDGLRAVIFAAKCSRGDGDPLADAIILLDDRLDRALTLLHEINYDGEYLSTATRVDRVRALLAEAC